MQQVVNVLLCISVEERAKMISFLNCVEYFCLFYLKKLAWSLCKVVLIQCGNGVTYVFVPATLP